MKKKRLNSILGLALDGHKFEAVVLRRTNGSISLLKSCAATLALDPLTNDAELVGREIRNHLEAAGIRERNCVVSLPSSWAFALQVPIPEIPEEDIPGFLEIEAERGFPYGPEALLISNVRHQLPGGEKYAGLFALQREHIATLESVLKHARLKPVYYALNVSSLAVLPPAGNAMVLAIGEVVSLQVSYAGGIPALRILEGAIDAEPGKRRIRADLIARECRITMGQLPEQVRESIRDVRIVGDPELAQTLAEGLRNSMRSLGINITTLTRFGPEDFGVVLPSEAPASAAFALAARYLADRPPAFKFILPKVSQWQQISSRYSSRKLAWIGIAAAIVLLLVGLLFGVQQFQLSRLRSQWAAISPRVTDLEDVQQQIRKYRPWFDNSFRTLTIVKRLTEAFPEEGSVTAKTVEIHEGSTVSCSGSARDSQALYKALDRLRGMKEIYDVKLDNVRGKTPLEFLFNFHWGERVNNER
jgi:hypothetical protein